MRQQYSCSGTATHVGETSLNFRRTMPCARSFTSDSCFTALTSMGLDLTPISPRAHLSLFRGCCQVRVHQRTSKVQLASAFTITTLPRDLNTSHLAKPAAGRVKRHRACCIHVPADHHLVRTYRLSLSRGCTLVPVKGGMKQSSGDDATETRAFMRQSPR